MIIHPFCKYCSCIVQKRQKDFCDKVTLPYISRGKAEVLQTHLENVLYIICCQVRYAVEDSAVFLGSFPRHIVEAVL